MRRHQPNAWVLPEEIVELFFKGSRRRLSRGQLTQNDFEYFYYHFAPMCNTALCRSTLHKAHDAEENPYRPKMRFLWVFLSGWGQGFCIVLEFLVTMWTGVRIEEIAEFNTAVRTS